MPEISKPHTPHTNSEQSAMDRSKSLTYLVMWHIGSNYPHHGRSNVFHASYLSPYKETIEHGPNFLEPPPDIVDGELEWEVEAIVDMRYYGPRKKKQYCVQWKGYSRAHDTWELEENIHAPELIRQYHRAEGTSIRAAKVSMTD